jgi:hypothetical protein
MVCSVDLALSPQMGERGHPASQPGLLPSALLDPSLDSERLISARIS